MGYTTNQKVLQKLIDSKKDFKVEYLEDHDGAHWDTESGEVLFEEHGESCECDDCEKAISDWWPLPSKVEKQFEENNYNIDALDKVLVDYKKDPVNSDLASQEVAVDILAWAMLKQDDK